MPDMLDIERLQRFLESMGFWAPLIFVLLQLLQVVFAPIPGNVITLAGALVFGFWEGFLLSSAAIAVGSLLCFGLGRRLGKAALRKWLKPARFDKYDKFISDEKNKARTYMLLFLCLLFPFMPDDLLCLLAGVTSIRFRTFAIMVVLARPWGLLAAALLGAYGLSLPLWLLIVIGALLLALGILAVRYAKELESWIMAKIRLISSKILKKSN